MPGTQYLCFFDNQKISPKAVRSLFSFIEKKMIMIGYWDIDTMVLTMPYKSYDSLNRHFMKQGITEVLPIEGLEFHIKPLSDVPVAWMKLNGNWSNIIPEFNLWKLRSNIRRRLKIISPGDSIFYHTLDKADSALTEMFNSIPEKAMKIIRAFPRIYWWRLLSLYNRAPDYAWKLFKSNPAIYFLVSYNHFFRETARPWRTALRLIKKKQVDILRHLAYLEPRPANVKLLRKARVRHFTLTDYVSLNRLYHEGNFDLQFRHIQILHPNSLYIFDRGLSYLVATSFLEDFSRYFYNNNRKNVINYLLGAHRYHTNPEDYDVESRPHLPFRNVDDLTRWHNRWVIRLTTVTKPQQDDIEATYPDPPFPGENWIKPLINGKLLFNEGRVMSNCAWSYHSGILIGTTYLYHIEYQDEKATLELQLKEYSNGTRRWNMTQVFGKKNRKISVKLSNRIKEWMERKQIMDSFFYSY